MSPWIKFVTTAILLMEVHLHAQDVLTVVTEGKSKCGSAFKLRCAPSSCCSGAINWIKGVTTIMTGGVSNPTGKYTQVTVAGSHFDFTIENLETADFSGTYECVFNGARSNGITLNANDYYCPPCWDCGGECFGFAVIGYIVALSVGFILSRFIDALKKRWIPFNIAIGVAGIIAVFIVNFLIGGYVCWCEENNGYYCIFIGFGVTVLVVLIVAVIFYFIEENSSRTGSSPPKNVNDKRKTENKGRSPEHLKTENKTSEKKEKQENISKLDNVPHGRPLPHIENTGNPPSAADPTNPDQRNITKLEPLQMTSDENGKKKKKKKKKKQTDALDDNGLDD